MSVACVSLLQKLLQSVARATFESLSASAGVNSASLYRAFRQLLITEEEQDEEPPSWPLDKSTLSPPSSLASDLDDKLAELMIRPASEATEEHSQEQKEGAGPILEPTGETKVEVPVCLPVPPSQSSALSCSTSSQQQQNPLSLHNVVDLFTCMLDWLIELMLTELPANPFNPAPINCGQDHPDDLIWETVEHINGPAETPAEFERPIKRARTGYLEGEPFLLHLFQLLSLVWRDSGYLTLIHRLKMQEDFGLLPDTESNRLAVSVDVEKNVKMLTLENLIQGDEGAAAVDDDVDDLEEPRTPEVCEDPADGTKWLFRRLDFPSINNSIDARQLGKVIVDNWKFKLQPKTEQASGSFTRHYADATDENGLPRDIILSEIDDLHSLLHARFGSVSKEVQAAADLMWWNDEALLKKYAVEAAAGKLGNVSVGGHPLLTQALHVKLGNFFGSSSTSILQYLLADEPVDGASSSPARCPVKLAEDNGYVDDDHLFRYFSFSLMDAAQQEFPFLAEIVFGNVDAGRMDRGVIYSFVPGQRSKPVGLLVPTYDQSGVHFDVERLCDAMPAFKTYKPHGEFHRSFFRFCQAVTLSRRMRAGCSTYQSGGHQGLNKFLYELSYDQLNCPSELNTVPFNELLEIEKAGEHPALIFGLFGHRCPKDPQVTFHDLIASSQMTAEQELQFEIETAASTMIGSFIRMTNRIHLASQFVLLNLADIQPMDIRRRFAELVRQEVAKSKDEAVPSSAAPASATNDVANSTGLIPDLAQVVSDYALPPPLLPFIPAELTRMKGAEWEQLLAPLNSFLY